MEVHIVIEASTDNGVLQAIPFAKRKDAEKLFRQLIEENMTAEDDDDERPSTPSLNRVIKEAAANNWNWTGDTIQVVIISVDVQ